MPEKKKRTVGLQTYWSRVHMGLRRRGKTLAWLAEEINAATGKHFDAAYLTRVFSGKRRSRTVVTETCRILELLPPTEYREEEAGDAEDPSDADGA